MNWQAFTLNALRIVTGFLFIPHGWQKLVERGVETFTQPWFAGVIELVGGALILIGLQTRWTAFLCSGLMAFAYWLVHGTKDLLPIHNGGELAMLYCFVFLFLWAHGGGDFSVDGMMKKRS